MSPHHYTHLPADTPLLDARHYRWRELTPDTGGVFDTFVATVDGPPKPRSVGEVFFNMDSFDRMDYRRNGVSLSFYGSGDVQEYAAIRLDNGHVLFCVVRGRCFTDTFHSAEQIAMRYYTLTPLPEYPDA